VYAYTHISLLSYLTHLQFNYCNSFLIIDQRSIVARLAKDSETGLNEAKDIYTNGRTGGFIGATISNEMTIKSLSTNAQEEFLGGSHSKTYLNFVDYYGDMDYADKWISAAFGGEETKFSVAGNLDFGKFDVEGRAGE